MKLTRVLYRNGWLFFVGFFGLVIWGFWNTYYSNPLQLTYATLHVHGFMMTLWCAMLVAQSLLIRANQRQWHRLLGQASYVVAPLVFASLIAVLYVGIPARGEFLVDGELTDSGYFVFTFAFLGALLFGFLYALAVSMRHKPHIHGRLMLCTVFPIATAGVDRIMGQFFPGMTARLAALPGPPEAQLVTWVSVDLILIGLSIWDWKSHRIGDVFPRVLVLMVAYQVVSSLAVQTEPWRALCRWFLGI